MAKRELKYTDGQGIELNELKRFIRDAERIEMSTGRMPTASIKPTRANGTTGVITTIKMEG